MDTELHLREHARRVKYLKLMHWGWRKMRALQNCKRSGFHSSAHDAFGDQVGHCLDRHLPYDPPEVQ